MDNAGLIKLNFFSPAKKFKIHFNRQMIFPFHWFELLVFLISWASLGLVVLMIGASVTNWKYIRKRHTS